MVQVAHLNLVADGQKLGWHDCQRVLFTSKFHYLDHSILSVVNGLLTCGLREGAVLPFLKMLCIRCFVLKFELHFPQTLFKIQTYS